MPKTLFGTAGPRKPKLYSVYVSKSSQAASDCQPLQRAQR